MCRFKPPEEARSILCGDRQKAHVGAHAMSVRPHRKRHPPNQRQICIGVVFQ